MEALSNKWLRAKVNPGGGILGGKSEKATRVGLGNFPALGQWESKTASRIGMTGGSLLVDQFK